MLYRATFTGREGTLACFELLKEQYEQREAAATRPGGVPAWFGQPGPLNLVTTWDVEYLPFSFTFLELRTKTPLERHVQEPTQIAVREGWKKGEVKTGSLKEVYERDPLYTLVSQSPEEIVYVWPDPSRDRSDVFIEKRYRHLGGYRIQLNVTIYNLGAEDLVNQPQIDVHTWEAEKKKRGLFAPAPNIVEGLCMTGEGDLESETGSDLLEEPLNPGGEARWVGCANRYFILGLISRGLSDGRCTMSAAGNGVVTTSLYRSNPFTVAPLPEARCHPDWYKPGEELFRCSQAAGLLDVSSADLFRAEVTNRAYAKKKESLGPEDSARLLNLLKGLSGSAGAVLYDFELYLGPKDIDRLREPGVGLEDSIDFWIVGFISKPMLYLLRWFYSLIPHWAFAIVMLTILVKLALLYWTQKSFAQMQRMAQLKPMMDELKTRYGKDKERLNQEMMGLYKREKVSPLGGCLPMLLQMPIWIALYRTIYSSVDLYQAPLGGWITDLSAPDPYFVMPLILGASMFVQQRLTPTTMDSAQAKMMQYIMPIMFTVFMLFLPSGLNLYILINTLLTMLQQWYLRRSHNVAKPKPQPSSA